MTIRFVSRAACAALLAVAGLDAQAMNGVYTINPTGSGNRNFTTFKDAGKALFFYNVDGPCSFRVSAGTYKETFILLPVEGASATNTITFEPLLPIPNSVRLEGATTSGDIILMLSGFASWKSGWYKFRNLVFQNGGRAIVAGAFTEEVAFQRCTFDSTLLPTTSSGAIHIDGANTSLRWEISDCTFNMGASRRAIYGSQVGSFKIFRNVFNHGTGSGSGIYLINLNNSFNEISNNLFYGTVSSSNSSIQVDLSNINNTIAHNTFLITTTAGNAIATFGTSGNFNKIYGNILYVKGSGTCLYVGSTSATLQHWASDGNCFWAPSGNVGKIGSTTYATLAAWQANGNTNQPQRDQSSIEKDPMLVDETTPDLHPKQGSPVQDVAVNTPTWVIEDYDRRVRDAKPDMGAYELNGFAAFGKGCPGTNSNVPTMGSTGTVGIGKSFQVTVANGKPTSPAVLAFGISRTQWLSIPLPIVLPGGCEILVSIDVVLVGATDASGAALWPFVIPNDATLVGKGLHLQWLILDSAANNPLGFAHSNGGSANL
jgi:hypothetical protein